MCKINEKKRHMHRDARHHHDNTDVRLLLTDHRLVLLEFDNQLCSICTGFFVAKLMAVDLGVVIPKLYVPSPVM